MPVPARRGFHGGRLTSSAGLRYRPEIDGLRAVAVCIVIAFHANNTAFPGGYIGVDVFFVISGYLISSIVFNEAVDGRFSVRGFYERRVRRIAPALTLVLLASTVAALVIFPPHDLFRYARDLVATIAFVPNIDYWRTRGYFAPAAEQLPLLHTWSLGVEEQFYIFFPPFLAWIAARRGRKSWPVVAALLVLSLALALVGPAIAHEPATFFLLPPRAWELLAGALLVFIPAEWRAGSTLSAALSAAGLIAISAGTFLIRSGTHWPTALMLVPVLGAVAIIVANPDTPSVAMRRLASRPVVATGLISYSLYLWHWPLLAFAQFLRPELTLGQILAVVVATFALATLSWWFVERPFRRRSGGMPIRAVLVSWAGCSALLVAFAAVARSTGGLPQRYPPSTLALLAAASEFGVPPRECQTPATVHLFAGRICALGSDVQFGGPVVVWGDSHAEVFTVPLDSMLAERAMHGEIALHGACPPLIGFEISDNPTCRSFNDSVMTLIKASSARDVVLIARWTKYSEDRSQFESAVNRTLAALAADGIRVYAVQDVPDYTGDVPRRLALVATLGEDLADVDTDHAAYLAQNALPALVFGAAQSAGRVRWISVDSVLCPGERCLASEHGKSLYMDSQHLSRAGALKVAPVLAPVLALPH
jgi:peptidoglycan/LPS O-acetylase OafA/YrhL